MIFTNIETGMHLQNYKFLLSQQPKGAQKKKFT